MSTQKHVSQALIKLGISPSLKGYHYLMKALDLYSTNTSLCSVLQQIAVSCNVSQTSVERAIKNVIHNGFRYCDKDFANEVFGDTPNAIPTNVQFIQALSNWANFQS